MAEKERKLTSGELKRKEQFEGKVQELAQMGYVKKDLMISPAAANILGIAIMVPVLVLLGWVYFVVNRGDFKFHFDLYTTVVVLFGIFALVFVHEGIHGLTWALFAKEHFHAIKFGFIWKMMMPYCTCSAALTKVQYILGAMAPTIVVGVLPCAAAIIWNSPVLFWISLIMVLSGGGDALITLKLLFYKETTKDSIYMDHPYECGMVVFERTS